jgi:hypothetical protein
VKHAGQRVAGYACLQYVSKMEDVDQNFQEYARYASSLFKCTKFVSRSALALKQRYCVPLHVCQGTHFVLALVEKVRVGVDMTLCVTFVSLCQAIRKLICAYSRVLDLVGHGPSATATFTEVCSNLKRMFVALDSKGMAKLSNVQFVSAPQFNQGLSSDMQNPIIPNYWRYPLTCRFHGGLWSV